MTKRAIWALPYQVFLALFVALPLVLIALYAFQDAAGHFTFGNFVKFATEKETMNTFVYSIEIALITTVLCLLLGYPAAYILADTRLNPSSVTVILFILPMWINMLIRTLATVALFDFLRLPLGEGALIFGMVYNFLPFMIYPIYNVLRKMDNSYMQAAEDLGANPTQVFTKVTLPLRHLQRRADGLYAHHLHFRRRGTADDEQGQTLRNLHPGEHQQRYVELRRGPRADYAGHHRTDQPDRGRGDP